MISIPVISKLNAIPSTPGKRYSMSRKSWELDINTLEGVGMRCFIEEVAKAFRTSTHVILYHVVRHTVMMYRNRLMPEGK